MTTRLIYPKEPRVNPVRRSIKTFRLLYSQGFTWRYILQNFWR